MAQQNSMNQKYFVNETIRAESIQVIDQHGTNIGVVSRAKALALAQEAHMDLVQVGEKDGMPIARMMDFGRFLYEKKKQTTDAKKHHKTIQIKEIKIRPNIGDGDYATKLKHAEEFFKDGKKVKFTLQFKGREMTMAQDLGKRMFERIANDLRECGLGALIEEKESRGGTLWSKIFMIKER